jgi:putative transposase
MKYIESNHLRANLVDKAENWKWGSLSFRLNDQERTNKLLSPWPTDYSQKNYLKLVNQPLSKTQLESIRLSVVCGKPLGEVLWVKQKIAQHDLHYTVRSEGRPKK